MNNITPTVVYDDVDRKMTKITIDGRDTNTLTAKQDCVFGGHYHLLTNEVFEVVVGEAKLLQLAQQPAHPTKIAIHEHTYVAGEAFAIPVKEYHRLECTAGTVVKANLDREYDPTDTYSLGNGLQ